MYPSGEVGLIDTIRNFTIERENFKHSQSESCATGIFRDWHKVKTNSLYNQSPKYFIITKNDRFAFNSRGWSLIRRGNVDIWVMEILLKTCWMRLLMLNVPNSFWFWRETTQMTNLLFSAVLHFRDLHFSIAGICNWTFFFVIRPFFALVFWHVGGFNQNSLRTCGK